MSRNTLKNVVAIVLCIAFAAIPSTLFYLLWSWCMAQVSATLVYAGLIKIAITLAIVLAGAGTTIGLTILFGTAAVLIASTILD